MNLSTLEFEKCDGIAFIYINRPQSANALNSVMAEEFNKVATLCDTDDTIKAVLISAKGKMFCPGGDLIEFSKNMDKVDILLKEMTTHLHSAISRFSRMNKPIVVAVQSVAAGAGFSLTLIADYLICSDKASFTMGYTAAGLSPDAGATYFLPRIIGERRAKELILTNRTLLANEALEWGLVNEVVTDNQLLTRSTELVKKLSKGSAGSYSSVKQLLLGSSSNSLETQLELESRAIASNAKSSDGQEGITAFLEKRPAVFS